MPDGAITALLGRVREGESGARDALLPLVYAELEAIARGYVRPEMSVEPRGLVHELYLRLIDTPLDARDRKHFYAIAALAMRQILVDRARRRRAAKRGGPEIERVTLSGLADGVVTPDVLDVDDALRRLEELNPRQARIVELRCLMGMSVPEVAEVLGVSERTVHGDWRMARAWLMVELART